MSDDHIHKVAQFVIAVASMLVGVSAIGFVARVLYETFMIGWRLL
jgi:hypothetical protein